MNQPTPYLFPLTASDEREVHDAVVKRLAALVQDDEDYFLALVPGAARLRGRELLNWYEQNATPEYMQALAAKYPDVARKAVLEWGGLIRKYGVQR